MTESTPARILIADDEPLYLRTTGELLRKAGYDCVCVPDAHAALEALSAQPFDLVLSDLNMPGNLKLELLHDERRNWPHIPLIVITGVPSIPTAIESIRLGIADYLLKPVKYEDLLASVRRALSHRTLRQDMGERSEDQRRALAHQFPDIIGNSPAMLELFDVVDRIAGTDTNILITGESGTGKEVVARAIHHHSQRRDHLLQVIDCTAIPETLFESMLFGHARGSFTGAVKDQEGLLKKCDGGTAFFDEIGELPATLQAKLLRVVQEQTFTPVGMNEPIQIDTRFICATNRDLQMEVNAGRFRRDLYYRLGVIHIDLPPLRERGDDVVLLAQHFLNTLQRGQPRVDRFSDEALDRFRTYHWPGNIRELRNAVERAIALARTSQVEVADLPSSIAASPPESSPTESPPPDSIPGSSSREEALDEAERAYLTSLLRDHRGNVSHAAQQAGMSRQGMHKLLKKHGIAAVEYRA